MAAAVRPHVALMFFVAFAPAFLLRRSKSRQVVTARQGHRPSRCCSSSACCSSARSSSSSASSSLNRDSAEELLARTRGQSSFGGSEFNARLPSLLTLPLSVVAVLFRPFPFEAHNFQTVLAAVEGILLLGLCTVGYRRLRWAVSHMFSEPFLLGCLLYVLLFAAAFGAIGNFGILARERVQVLPFVFFLLSVPIDRLVLGKLKRRRTPLAVGG